MTSNLGYDAPQNGPQAQHWQPPYGQEQQPQAPFPQAPFPEAPYPQAPPPLGPPRRPPHSQVQDPESWPVIRQSAARLSRDQEEFARQLHYEVTALVPDLDQPGAPGPDMWAFCERMARTLLWVALTEQPLGVVADTLRRVGAQNWIEGFPDTQYANVAHALVQTVHYLVDSDWSASTGSMWISFFMWIKPHLIAGAQQAAAELAAAQREGERRAAAQRAAAEREAARVKARSRDPRGGHPQVAGDADIEPAASPPDDDGDDEDTGYGQIMASTTRTQRRDQPRHKSDGAT